ncbi:MAG: hypothetical protein OXI59_02210, partial [Gemmatimonadota bacterium]|nr:hypothetical protein [Gemmatimonadota bacterium]
MTTSQNFSPFSDPLTKIKRARLKRALSHRLTKLSVSSYGPNSISPQPMRAPALPEGCETKS